MSGWSAWPFLILVGWTLSATPAVAQLPPEPPPADTVLVPVPPDTLPTAVPPDTLPESPRDTLPPVDLPRIRSAAPAGWETGTWSWDRQDLMARRDLTLLELMESIPGLVPLRGGDYGAPEAASAFAFGGGRVRLFWDGFEQVPLDGGVPDLALVGLGGVESLRIERGPGELRIHLESLRGFDPRPYSLVEAGTGDLDTHFFRGSFLHPQILGGILGVALERVDTRGPFRRERGSRVGGWLSWGRPIGDNFGVRAEARRMSHDVALAAFPVAPSRTDWVVRGRGVFLDSAITAEVFTGASSLGSDVDEAFVPLDRSTRQHGVRASWEAGPAWLSGTLRLFDGDGVPSRSLELHGGGTLPGIGGGYARWSTDAWSERAASDVTLHGWTAPLMGLSGFASYGSGVRGSAVYPPYQPLPLQPEEPADLSPLEQRFTDQATLRLGGTFRWNPLLLQGAWLSMDVDSLPPLGLVLDRPGPVVPGGTYRGWEGLARVPLPVAGFALAGSMQWWNQEARYLPRRIYRGAVEFHDVFLDTRNLEVWGELGVRGRSAMLVPVQVAPGTAPGLARVPFYQNWYADLQVRVVTVNVFIRWENFTFREELQDFPGRRLPFTRAVYGVRWTMWN